MFKVIKNTVSIGLVLCGVGSAYAKATKYEIYPNPQKIEYKQGNFKIGDKVNIVCERGIDSYTKKRLAKILKESGVEFSSGKKVVSGQTNILLGLNGSRGMVDRYFNKNVPHKESFFSKNDAHIVSVHSNIIAVLGVDADSVFYGVTTLKHVFNQLEENQIREFRVDDYSDVKHRGFIEGYYGNPWSNEDRAELMRFGGDYKLNTYFFAPKDDIYHNKKWRELYPAKELAEIKKLAKVGNETKNKYVYALHPFMHHAIRFDSESNYQKDLNIIKAKFTQLLENDVRAFSILADDAGVPRQGPGSYVKLLKDLTVWLKSEKSRKYPDLVTDLPFCSNDYMGNGSSPQLKVVNQSPASVSIIMTGGRIWGEVSEGFTSNFKDNIASSGYEGRPPYLWINWPCTDNSKQHLIMGGNDTFLHPGVNPDNIRGIVLNPMQQAEANKSALFAIADYGWNVWDSKEQADRNWHDSFKYMNHGTAEENEASSALRTIARHMINQNMDGRVRRLEESVELAPKLNDFQTKLKAGTLSKKDTKALIREFDILKNAAAYYKKNAGNERTRDQVIHWLKCWDDTTTAAINYLKCLDAVMDGDNAAIWSYYSAAHSAFEKSKTYRFWYVDHYENAEVGVQHIVPFIKKMGTHLNDIVSGIIDPSKVIQTYITSRKDSPAGDTKSVLDGDSKSGVVYKDPASIEVGDYVGVRYSKLKLVNSIEFHLGTNANPKDTFASARIEVTRDCKKWVPLSKKVYSNPNLVKVENINLKVLGIRMVALKSKGNSWLGVRDIVVNKAAQEKSGNYSLAVSVSSNIGVRAGGDIKGIVDGSVSSGLSFASNPYSGPGRDSTPEGAFIRVDLEQVEKIGLVTFVQGNGDKLHQAALEYSVDGRKWKTLNKFGDGQSTLQFDASEMNVKAKSLRVRNLKATGKWWEVKEFTVAPQKRKSLRRGLTNTKHKLYAEVALDQAKLIPVRGLKLKTNDYVGIKLDRIKDLKSIKKQVSSKKLTLQVSVNAIEWHTVLSNKLPDARYIRLINKTKSPLSVDIKKFEVNSNEIHPLRYIKGHAGIYKNSKPEQAFDGDFNSTVFFNKGFSAGETIEYDLGQVVRVDNLKYVVLDTDTDHVRDARFQLSLDGKIWKDAFTATSASGDRDAKPQDNGYKHGSLSNGVIPISHSYLEGKNLNTKARYFRILATKSYHHRWVRISEILINNGRYIKPTNDPTYDSDPIEMKGHGPKKMFDGDLTTSYRPNTNNGKIKRGFVNYKLSKKTNVKQINIVQNGNAISNAKVMVRTGKNEWHQLGVLDQSLNAFKNTKYKHIFELKIEWRGVAPSIYEIAISSEG